MDSIEKTLDNSLKPVNTFFQKTIDPVFETPLINTVLIWLVVINIVFHINDIPENFQNILKSSVMRFVLTFTGVYLVSKDVKSSLLVSLVVFSSFHLLKLAIEKFDIISPTFNSVPGCVNVKVDDLMDLFKGDKKKLKRVMYASGVPLNLKLNNKNAPLIATYLVNFGHKVTENCKLP